jgi:phenylalanyl-tRNA synthetase beta chain
MICSAYELDLGDDSNGIIVLDQHAKVGQELSKYFGLDDIVYEVGITPNRPDAMNHIGIAREVAALAGKSLKTPSVKLHEVKKKASDYASIKIEDKALCPRYTARLAPLRSGCRRD